MAAVWAIAELLLGLAIGEFAARARAEPIAFLMVRPPLLAVLAWAASQAGWRERISAYLLSIALASAGETLLLTFAGGPFAPLSILRAVLVAAVLLSVFDGLLQIARRFSGRVAAAIVMVLLVMAAGLPVVRHATTAFTMAGRMMLPGQGAMPDRAPARRLAMVTALPIVWGEGDLADVLAGRAQPAEVHRVLQRAYAVTPLDRVDRAALAGYTLLMIAQPRALDPEELVAIDDWVRAGGRVLVLADPALVWPSRWPVGDRRRAPLVTLLDPLLMHWGLAVDTSADSDGLVVRMLGHRRLETHGVGRFTSRTGACRIGEGGMIATCSIGRGRAMLVADADLLDGRAWMGPGVHGATRDQRRADNDKLLLAWLASLSGQPESVSRDEIAWLQPGVSLVGPVTIGLIPGLFALVVAGWLAKWRGGALADFQGAGRGTRKSSRNRSGTAHASDPGGGGISPDS